MSTSVQDVKDDDDNIRDAQGTLLKRRWRMRQTCGSASTPLRRKISRRRHPSKSKNPRGSAVSIHLPFPSRVTLPNRRLAPIMQFYNIRRYTSCGVVQEEDHPFDEVDSNKCGPRCQPPVRTASFGCGVPEMVRGSLQHQDRVSKPCCKCVKCSVTNMYSYLLSKK